MGLGVCFSYILCMKRSISTKKAILINPNDNVHQKNIRSVWMNAKKVNYDPVDCSEYHTTLMIMS